MPLSLSEKLAALGVKVGTQNIAPPAAKDAHSLMRILDGQVIATQAGETFLIESLHALDAPYGRMALGLDAPLTQIAQWASDARIADVPIEQIAFLDVETTGLSSGTGTLAFLVGVGRYADGQYQLAQFFLREPGEEGAHLLALEAFLAPSTVLVTFNGKSFDVPLLNQRYIRHGWRSPLPDLAQIDLLHLARRLWRDRLPSRTLGTLEVEVLGYRRSGEDIPGWMVPQMYFDYLHTGDARPLTGVIYHNAVDVLSMAALLNHAAHILADPLGAELDDDRDRPSLARLFADLGQERLAISLYQRALESDLPLDLHLSAILQLAMLHKRCQDWQAAIPLWQQAAQRGQIEACEELSKYYEHQSRQYEQALLWTEHAQRQITAPGAPSLLRYQWQAQLTHRQQRLLRKLNADTDLENSPHG